MKQEKPNILYFSDQLAILQQMRNMQGTIIIHTETIGNQRNDIESFKEGEIRIDAVSKKLVVRIGDALYRVDLLSVGALPVTSVFGRNGNVVVQDNDYNASQIKQDEDHRFVTDSQIVAWSGISSKCKELVCSISQIGAITPSIDESSMLWNDLLFPVVIPMFTYLETGIFTLSMANAFVENKTQLGSPIRFVHVYGGVYEDRVMTITRLDNSTLRFEVNQGLGGDYVNGFTNIWLDLRVFF
jgi:hypothetical protein